MSSLFGRCIATQCAQWLDGSGEIVEFGAGSGALAAQLLSALRDARALPRGYVIVGAFVVAAVITPPDVISQLMLAIPMCLLYEVGLLVARSITRQREADAPTDSE